MMVRYIYIFTEEMEGMEDHVVYNPEDPFDNPADRRIIQIIGIDLWLIGNRLSFRYAILQ